MKNSYEVHLKFTEIFTVHLNAFKCSGVFYVNNSIPSITGMNFAIPLCSLPQNAIESFVQVKFSLMKNVLLLLKLYFWLLMLIRFLLLINALLQYVGLTNFSLYFPILWHALISQVWITTSTSSVMEVTAYI